VASSSLSSIENHHSSLDGVGDHGSANTASGRYPDPAPEAGIARQKQGSYPSVLERDAYQPLGTYGLAAFVRRSLGDVFIIRETTRFDLISPTDHLLKSNFNLMPANSCWR
jgi:hypothetical protein